MQLFNQMCLTTLQRYDNYKQTLTEKVKSESEKGAISLEAAIIGGVLIVMAVAIALKFGNLQDDAESKIPDSL